MDKLKLYEIVNESFWQLLLVYSILIFCISIGLFSKYALYFNFFALLIALLGFYFIKSEENEDKLFNKKLYNPIFALSIFFILLFRLIPYLYSKHKIPLGYDAGLYKYAIEHGLENMDIWIRGGVEPGFLYFMKFLNSTLNISSYFLLTYGFILCILGLGLSIFYFTLVYFKNKDIALLSILIYSISLVQFKVFTYLYYKNIIAIAFTLLGFSFLYKNKYWLFTVFGILVGIFHRPSFYIFGLSFLAFSIISPYRNKKYDTKLFSKYVLHGSIIVGVSMLFFIGQFSSAITNLIYPVANSFVQTGSSPGTFIDFFDYQFSILFYLPLAILGFLLYIKNNKKEIYKDVFFYYTIFLIIIVVFKLFFFNRYLIFLDIVLIIFASYGSYHLLKSKKYFFFIIISILFVSGIILTFNASIEATPTIPKSIFDTIESIDLGENENNYIISISSEYTPYLQGYIKSSGSTKVIAPGMFDYDVWNSQKRWEIFWQDQNASDLKEVYGEESTIYLFTPQKINNSCYSSIENVINLYKWVC